MHKSADFITSLELIPSGMLWKWIQRPGLNMRQLTILMWIVMGTFLTLGYKSTLLSSLIKIRYEATIDSLHDLDKSGISLLLPEGGDDIDFIRRDPREVMARLYKRIIEFPYQGGIPEWVYEM